MIHPESFTKEHIKGLQEKSHRDPVLLERAVYAFGLLEALARVELPFVFKGGTCLLLLLKTPRRLSTDIDIIVQPGTDLDAYLKKASVVFPFVAVEEQRRKGKNSIEKRHFKFTYDSPTYQKPFYILLDVLFEETHYADVVCNEIRSELLVIQGDCPLVKTPSIDCILADKLTAFAPHTTGILLHQGKDMEVMKQMYDVCSLLDVFTDFEKVKQTYHIIAQAELAYRGIEKSPSDCLLDTFATCACIASRGKINAAEYPLYVKGIRDLRGHIYVEHYSPEIAAQRAVQVMYLAMCLLTDCPFERLADDTAYLGCKLTHETLMPLRYIKKVNLQAYACLIKIDGMMQMLDYEIIW